MLEKIKQISNAAKNELDLNLCKLNEKSAGYNDCILIKNAYVQLDELIKAAEDQNATVGSYILLNQLSQKEQEEQKLNAAILLRNFLKVLDYPVSISFDISHPPSEQSGINTAKVFAVVSLVMMFSIFIPMLLVSGYPWLLLIISALPLAITYAYDEPFSMARFYQEMAGIEKALAFFVLFAIFTSIVCAFLTEVTIMITGILLLGSLSTGLFLLWHSNNLQSKHEYLRDATINIQQSVKPFIDSNASNFFKGQRNLSDDEHLRYMEQTLFACT